MEAVFQVVRFPVAVVWAVLLLALFPFWTALGLVILVLGAAFLPVYFVVCALSGNHTGLDNYVSALFDFPDWFRGYGEFWGSLARWQTTGSTSKR